MIVVVLGCAVRVGADGAGLAEPLAARVRAAAGAWAREAARGAAPIVVASGGKAWGGVVEADAIARELVRRGVPERAIVRERGSMSTRENAARVVELLAARGVRGETLAIVTCAWHLPRAVALFRAHAAPLDARVHGVAADGARGGVARRVWRWGRERVAAWKDGVRPARDAAAVSASRPASRGEP